MRQYLDNNIVRGESAKGVNMGIKCRIVLETICIMEKKLSIAMTKVREKRGLSA